MHKGREQPVKNTTGLPMILMIIMIKIMILIIVLIITLLLRRRRRSDILWPMVEIVRLPIIHMHYDAGILYL